MTDIIPKFKEGNVVKLKSGSTDMTVDELDYQNRHPYKSTEGQYFTGYVYCVWFENNKPQDRVRYNQESLDLVR